MSQQFCLKWNNHTTNMLQVFENLLSTEALVDVTLACDGLSLKAHKMVLSACSPFFQSLFLENPCKHPIVIMKDMRYSDLKAIIDFMYRGEVNVSHDQLSALLKTAETLKVKGLAEVTGENRQASGIVQQEITQQSVSTPTPITPSAQRTDTPPLQGKRKRGRPRKRSLSDSNRSDDEGVAAKIKEPDSPEIEELSGDASMEATSDIRSGGGPVSSNSQSQVPIHSSNSVNTFSKSHLSISQEPQVEEQASGDENEFEVEPSKLLEQTLTTDNVPSNSQNSTGPITLPSVSGLEISRRSMSSTDSVSQALVPASIPSDSLGSNLQGPDSPQDIKPQILSFDDPPISPVPGPSHGSERSMMMYMDQSGVASIPGPSNYQDNSALVPHDSQPQ
ncbi:Protein bric-a-brac 1, partial [Stegodyphus mimosarum]